MKIHHFFIDSPLNTGETTITDSDQIHQIVRVLRLAKGEPIALLDGSGRKGVGTIQGSDKNSLSIYIETIQQVEQVPTLPKTLYVAIAKKDKFEWIAEKATEIGIGKIVPLVTDRTIKTSLNTDRIKKIIQEAVEQSGRGIIPEIGDTLTLEDALIDAQKYPAIFLAHQDGAPTIDTEFFAGFVGPEGGWSDRELALFDEYHIQKIKLAPFVLRTETAAILACNRMIQ